MTDIPKDVLDLAREAVAQYYGKEHTEYSVARLMEILSDNDDHAQIAIAAILMDRKRIIGTAKGVPITNPLCPPDPRHDYVEGYKDGYQDGFLDIAELIDFDAQDVVPHGGAS